MKHIIHMEADNYPDLRDQIRQLAVDHGLVMGAEGGLIGYAGRVGFDGYAEAAALIRDQLAEKAKQEAEAKAEAAASDTKLDPIGVITTPGKSRDKEAEAKAKAAAEIEAAVEAKPEKKADKPSAKQAVTLDQARAQVMAYVKENGQVKGKELIESFGAAKLSDVPADKLADLFAAAGGAL